MEWCPFCTGRDMTTDMRRKPLLVALALLAAFAVVAGTAGAVGTDADARTVDEGFREVRDVQNTTNYLSPEATDRSAYVPGDVDVAAAAGASAQRLQAGHERRAFDARYEADSGTDRVVLVRETADDMEARLARLDARHAALLAAYSNGTLSAETTMRRLVELSVEAETTRNHLEHVSDRVEDNPDDSVPVPLERRLIDLQSDLVTLPDPVTDRVEAGLAGERDAPVVYAGGATGGIVLATVDDGDFVRTATVRDDYAPDRPDQFETAEGRDVILALQRGGELYPWAYENDIGGPQIRGFGNTGLYLIRVDYGHGVLQTYISGGTTNAFHEIQTQDPRGVPISDTTVRATDSLNVTVETTTDSGPMRVSLIQPSSGAPLDGTVRVDGDVVGRTGQDGTLWTVQPAGRVRVNVTDGPNSAEFTVS